MSDAHARQYYSNSGSETAANSGPIATYDYTETGPAALDSGMPVEPVAPQSGLNAPRMQDQRRGSS
jgi:hypothetical protein